jgi:hypothetical protein
MPLAAPLVGLNNTGEFGKQLRQQTAAVRLRTRSFGTRRKLPKHRIAQAAEVFDADARRVFASKTLLDTKAPVYKGVTGTLSRAKQYWRACTVPYPDAGIRLIQRSRIESFQNQMAVYVSDLDRDLAELRDAYKELRDKASVELGDLFDDADYPVDITSEFGLSWEFPTLAVPEYLKQLNPQLYEAEMARLESRFEEAVRLNEQQLAEELAKLTGNLLDKLTGDNKVIRASAVANFDEFFQRFSDMSTGANPALAEAVEAARKVVGNVDPTQLRKDAGHRQTVADAMQAVQTALDAVLVDRPARQFQFDDDEEGGAS